MPLNKETIIPKTINVTQPCLPPIHEYVEYLQNIWDNKRLTNNGPLHQELESQLAVYLGVPYISLFSNGTLALISALQALNIEGEVITTPFSFVATTHALWWNKIKPVFVDIEPEFLNMDVSKIEAAITKETKAILPVHVYGNPCNTKEIKEIAEKYGLYVIYDAAHAFGVKVNGQSVLNFGDLSVLSFHATKVFSTIEGGAVISHSEHMKRHIDNLKNFGFRGEVNIEEPGINAKMNEFQAAYGLLQLKYIDGHIYRRKEISALYRKLLHNVQGISYMNESENIQYSYTYFPVLINREVFGKSRDEVYEVLKMHNIFTRRYFYPLISNLEPYKTLPSACFENLPNANDLAEKILCLPLFVELTDEDVFNICDILLKKN